MAYELRFSMRAMSDFEKIKKSGDKVVLAKLQQIFKELMEHPLTGTGKFAVHQLKVSA